MAEDGLTTLVNQVRKYVEFARRIMRRWWIIVIFFVLGAGGSVGFALKATRIYQSRALVEVKQIVDRQSLGWDSSGHQDNWLKHQVGQLTASNTLLLKIANDLDLYPKERKVTAPEVILEYLRNAIKFNTVGTNSFWISFDYKDPLKAQQACGRLVQEFIQQNVQDKLRAAKATQNFMEQEAGKVKKQLSAISSKLSQFKSEHPELQIDPMTGRPQIVPVNTPRLRGVKARILYLSARSPELKRALAEKGRLQARLIQLNPRTNTMLNAAQSELARSKRYLATLKQKYTEKHPDVIAAMQRVQQVQGRVLGASQSRQANSSRASTIRQEIADLDAKIARLSRGRVVKPKPGPAAVPARKSKTLSNAAMVEKQWYELTGEETVIRAKNEQIQVQLQRSRLEAGMKRQQAEKEFSIVDAASKPGKPIRPSRKKIVIAGTALGLMMGLGLAALLVLFDPRIYNEDDLRKACNLEVLAQIPKHQG